ncbi:MAG: SAM-dependent methyltransferase [Pseudomonadota bacterium]
MTPLARRLVAEIQRAGPMDIAQFMRRCLADPEDGYYTTRDPLGRRGDFTTAPEISQMFGELLGLWLATVWQNAGRPDRFTLAELGPGRGTAMADALRAAGRVPGFTAAMRLHLVEVSPVLRAEQAGRMPAGTTWCTHASALPTDAPLFVLANEFFDALPIRQHVAEGPLWRERRVGVDAAGALQFGLGPAVPNPDLSRRFGAVPAGTLVETNPAAEGVVRILADTIAARGGAALIIDYGAWSGTGDTLQALRAHAPEPPLAHPGDADVTAHVGFRWLAEAARPLRAAFSPQGAFLAALGIGARAAALARVPGAAPAVAAALTRLTDPAEMGTLFSVLALLPADAAPPPGFAP